MSHALLSQTQSFLTYVGIAAYLETTKGLDLPGAALFPLLGSEAGRSHLCQIYSRQLLIAKSLGLGTILEAPTWAANRDRGAKLGFSSGALQNLTRAGLDLVHKIRNAAQDGDQRDCCDVPCLISANIGPRVVNFGRLPLMTVKEAEHYHSEQMAAVSQGRADLVTGYTMTYPAEATGIVLAARQFDLPVVITFSVGADGCLPNGKTVGGAIAEVETATDGYASYYMLACGHPDHVFGIVAGAQCPAKLQGVVAHARFRDGVHSSEALAEQLSKLSLANPRLTVLGAYRGADMSHLIDLGMRMRAMNRSG